MRYDWNALNRQQVGAFAEYFVKMELTMYGFEVYTTEVDDRGIDFVARRPKNSFLTFQVKSFRESGYVFMTKDKFDLSKDVYLALVKLNQGHSPNLYLIPSLAWEKSDALLIDHNYEGKKSKPEWGLNLSIKNLPMLDKYSFNVSVASMENQRPS